MTDEELIIENMPLAYSMANKFSRNGHEVDDLAMIGLIKGVKTYDKKKGKLSTYLGNCILNEIYDGHRKNKNPENVISFSTPIESNITIEDSIKCDTDIERDLINKSQLKFVYNKISKLKDEEQVIIKCYYGIDTEPMSQLEISRMIGVSLSCLNKRFLKIMSKLRKECKEYE